MNKLTVILLFFSAACNTKTQRMQEKFSFNESVLKSFIISTPGISEGTALSVLDSILDKSIEDSTVFLQTVSYLETPLGDPNSSYRNEDLYSNLLQAKIKSPWYDDNSKEKIRTQLYLLMQNRVSAAANDFTYITPAGLKKKMYDLHSNFTLMYFYNPECNACKEMKDALISSPVTSEKVKSGELKILAIYTDRDEKLWLDHLPGMPQNWIHGRDEDEYLFKNSVYDLRAIPTLYLLDEDKKVLVKDGTNIAVIEALLK